jgi:hypothetical protein
MQQQRRRIGCLGQFILLGLLLGLGFIAVMAVTNPWIFTVGGHLRVLPFWQGVGDIQGPGGSYRIFVSLQPSNASSHVLPSTSVSGTGWVCAPSGHNYQIRVDGGAHEVVWRDMNNKSLTFYTWQRGTWSNQHLPPKLKLVGRWVGPNLVMDDDGTTASAFLVDGTLNPRPGTPGPKRVVTFVETQWWFGRPCAAHAAAHADSFQ